MALILSIDTSGDIANTCIGRAKSIIAKAANDQQKDHASFIQPAIEKILNATSTNRKDIDAVAVCGGPGSYTGLRVGMATAKGLCFALNKPLIVLNTLEVMAFAAISKIKNSELIYCPMIDARRLEVFTALFTSSLTEVMATAPLVLTEKTFISQLIKVRKDVVFFGSGMPKWKRIAIDKRYSFYEEPLPICEAMNQLAQKACKLQKFSDLAYSEPMYFKQFYTTAKIQ